MRIVFRLLLVLSIWLAGGQVAQARWLSAESPQFIVYSDGDEKGLRAFTERLEDYDSLLRLLTRTTAPPSPNKLHVYLLPNREAVTAINPYNTQHVVGFYIAGPRGTFDVAQRYDAADDLQSAQSVVFHEYTHHFVAQYHPGRYPRWYNEGIAEYYSTAAFKGDVVEVGRPEKGRILPLVQLEWLPTEALVTDSVGRTGPGSEMFYPEAWLATHYLLSDPDRARQLVAYVEALRKGAKPSDAFPAAFGMDFKTFDKVLKAYRFGTIKTLLVPRPAHGPIPITISELPPSADQMLFLSLRLQGIFVKSEDEVDLLAQVRELAAQYPDDPLAMRTLASAEINCGSPEAADPILDKLLAGHPDDVEALYLKGLRYIVAGRQAKTDRAAVFAKARPFLTRAHQIDPNHYPSLYLYAQSHGADPGTASDNTLNIFVLAHELAPQVQSISMRTGVALMQADRYDEAASLFESIAYAPHPTAESEQALKLLTQAKAHAPASPAD